MSSRGKAMHALGEYECHFKPRDFAELLEGAGVVRLTRHTAPSPLAAYLARGKRRGRSSSFNAANSRGMAQKLGAASTATGPDGPRTAGRGDHRPCKQHF